METEQKRATGGKTEPLDPTCDYLRRLDDCVRILVDYAGKVAAPNIRLLLFLRHGRRTV